MGTILIADSGGTRTDWCFLRENGERYYFEGRSLHPMYITEQISEEDKLFWDDKKEMLAAELQFFGAGCLNPGNAEKLQAYFTQLGFSSVHVRSDIHAAAFALLENGTGTIAIMGTGSVAAEFVDLELRKIIGGLGYILGDEGSGFYFGKLLVSELLDGRLDTELSAEVFRRIGDRASILAKVYGQDGREFLASLPKVFSSLESVVIDQLHEQNIRLFLSRVEHKLTQGEQSVHFVGSYAFYRKDTVQKLMSEMGLKAGRIIQKPIEDLTEYFFRTAF